jgi:hypothetical protein
MPPKISAKPPMDSKKTHKSILEGRLLNAALTINGIYFGGAEKSKNKVYLSTKKNFADQSFITLRISGFRDLEKVSTGKIPDRPQQHRLDIVFSGNHIRTYHSSPL